MELTLECMSVCMWGREGVEGVVLGNEVRKMTEGPECVGL